MIVCQLLEIDDTPSDRAELDVSWSISDGGSYSGSYRIEHFFSAIGDQVVTVTLTDDDGAVFTANHTVLVKAREVPDSGFFNSGEEGDVASALLWLGAAIIIGAIVIGGGMMLIGLSRRADSEYEDEEYLDEEESNEEYHEQQHQEQEQQQSEQQQQSSHQHTPGDVNWQQDEHGVWWWQDQNGDWHQDTR